MAVACVAMVLGTAGTVLAQTETHSVHIGTGTVLAKSGTMLIIDVTEGEELGPRKFSITEDQGIKFFKYGKEVTVLDINVGNVVSAYRTETATPSSVKVTYEEVEQIKKAAPAPAPKPAPAPAPAPAPTTLPSTGSAVPLVLTLGVVFLVLGLSLTVLRRL
jgi:hypothetical protein